MSVTETSADAHPVGQHRVQFELTDDYLTGDIICDAPGDAFCRVHCPHNCEQWSNSRTHPCGPDDAPHTLEPLHDGERCLVAEFIEAQGVLDSHTGGPEPVMPDAVIEVEWDDGYLWRYASKSEDSSPTT